MHGETVRPVTGRLLAGGGTIKFVNGSIYGSWLLEDNPEQYLFKEINFICGDNDIRDGFLVPAMRSQYPSILFDVPLDPSTGTLRKGHFITVLYLREGDQWRNAKIICYLSRGRDLVIKGNWSDDTTVVWRKWDKQWFRERILEGVTEQIMAKRCIKNPNNIVALYEAMYTHVEREIV